MSVDDIKHIAKEVSKSVGWKIFYLATPFALLYGGMIVADHFQIKSNNEKIMTIIEEENQKMSYDAFTQYMAFQQERNDLLRELIAEHKNDNQINIAQIEDKLDKLNKRIDGMFDTFGIGIVRGDDFGIDIMPEIFKTEL